MVESCSKGSNGGSQVSIEVSRSIKKCVRSPHSGRLPLSKRLAQPRASTPYSTSRLYGTLMQGVSPYFIFQIESANNLLVNAQISVLVSSNTPQSTAG